MTAILDITQDTISREKQLLIFCNSKRGAEKQAEDIAKFFKKKFHFLQNTDLQELAKTFKKSLPAPTKQCERNAFCIEHAVCFHHAGLTNDQRTLIENSFRSGRIKVICSTPTLAAGLNMPAFRVIVKDVKRYTGKWGMQYIPTLEYLQMAGRAGRPGLETYGEAIIIAGSESEKQALLEKYVYGDVESIQSKLAVEPVLRFHILSLISSRFVTSRTQLTDFFSKTFYAKQYGDLEKLEQIIEKVLVMLTDYKFLEGSQGDFISADTLATSDLRATPLGRRVSELYLDPYTAHMLIESFKKASTIPFEKLPFALLQSLSYTIEMEPLLRVKNSEVEDIHSIILQVEEYLLHDVPNSFEIDDFLNSIKTALFFQAWIQEADDETLLERFDIRPGEIRAKLEIIEWLIQASIELARYCSLHMLIPALVSLQVRLKYGAKEELLPLLKLRNIGRIRARALFRAGYTQPSLLKTASRNALSEIVGPAIANDILSQVGVASQHKGSLQEFLE